LEIILYEAEAGWKRLVAECHPDIPGGDSERATLLNAAIERVRDLIKGRMRPETVAEKISRQPGYSAHYETVRKKAVLKCAVCGNDFEANWHLREKRRFCSNSCALKFTNPDRARAKRYRAFWPDI
jgi:hypothetical protein